MTKKKPLALIIMDGWGDNPIKDFNAVAAAKTPNLDSLEAHYAHTDIQASGIDVGLPAGQMGNSEVGHTNIGAGRIVYQELTRIGKAIEDGDFFKNETLCKAVDAAVKADKAVHIMGLMSPGGVHSHQDHIVAMIKLAAQRGAKKVYFHAFTDGRDVAPRSAHEYIKVIENAFKEAGVGRIATMVGRYYAMDRDNRWDRVQQAYDLLTQAKSEFAPFATADEALDAAYARDENDEFVKASVIGEKAPLQDGDRFCQACGAEQLPEEESKKRICPECGKWIQADGKFCPFCGSELPEMDDDEPVIDEATGTETFVHKHREPVRDEEPPRSPQPMERPVMTGRPTPPPFQEPPFYVRYRKGIITAVVVLILAVAAAVAFHFYGSRSSGDYVKDAVSLSQQLSSENESVTDTAKRLSQKSKGDDVDSD